MPISLFVLQATRHHDYFNRSFTIRGLAAASAGSAVYPHTVCFRPGLKNRGNRSGHRGAGVDRLPDPWVYVIMDHRDMSRCGPLDWRKYDDSACSHSRVYSGDGPAHRSRLWRALDSGPEPIGSQRATASRLGATLGAIPCPGKRGHAMAESRRPAQPGQCGPALLPGLPAPPRAGRCHVPEL